MKYGSDIKHLTFAEKFGASPAWSLDGTIAFAEQDHTHFDIFIMNADGTGEKRLTVDRATYYKARWSPCLE
ncbi:MAG: hypothetical protein HYY11_04170 [Candidatus Methylomirabilis oxyfera]|nr:hypothetical protein [Candidatus Methylomirabilis oxyfera]